MRRLLVPGTAPAALSSAGAVLCSATLVGAAFLSVAAGQPPATGGTGERAVATLLTPDGDMRLTLTARALRVGFTAQGDRRIRRAADSAFAAEHPDAARAKPTRGARADAEEAKTPREKPIPLRELREVRAAGDSLVLCFGARPGVAEPACGLWRRIVVTRLAPADARQFAAAVRRAQDADAARR